MKPDEQTLRRWFGADADMTLSARAYEALDEQLQRRFGVSAGRSPGLAGLQCWRKHQGRDWKPIDPGLQTLIRMTTGQGRFEVCPAMGMISNLYVLDRRLAYVASAMTIRSGPTWRHEDRGGLSGWPGEPVAGVEGFLGYTPARYRVRFEVPASWDHVGILPARGISLEGDRWCWPCAPGYQWDTWADAAEVQLAIECGWRIEILERIICLDPLSESKTLRTWAAALLRMRDEMQYPDPSLYHTAVRTMILNAIGMMAMRPKTEIVTIASRADLPGHDLGEESHRELDDGSIEYEDYAASNRNHLLHPEIAAMVWARARVALLRQRMGVGDATMHTGALSLQREQIVGFGQDCIYSTHDPVWPDDGAPGRYRVKQHVAGPLPAPRSRADLEALLKSDGS